MYQRKNAGGGILPTTGNGSYSDNGGYMSPGASGYRPNYPAAPNFASGMSKSSSMDYSSKSRKKTSAGFLFNIPQYIYWIIIGILLFVVLTDRLQLSNVKRKLEAANKKVNRRDRDRQYGSDVREKMDKEKSNHPGDRKLQKQLDQAMLSLQRAENQLDVAKQQKQQLESEKNELLQELEDHHIHHHSEGEDGDDDDSIESSLLQENIKKMEKREETLFERIALLQEKIQRESSRELLERFGEGPYFVQINLILPTEVVTETFPEESNFVIETASIDQMPHTVHLFLEQVVHGLWKGCSFVINAAHIVQIGPHSFSSVTNKLKPFEDLKLDKVAFQEYNTSFPHEKYTLGLAGRPAGPDFYINKVNNTENHGPGGQNQHALDEEADPCFAKVVSNFGLLEHIFKMKSRGAQGILQHEIVIDSMNILNDYTVEKKEGLRQQSSKISEMEI